MAGGEARLLKTILSPRLRLTTTLITGVKLIRDNSFGPNVTLSTVHTQV